MSKKRAMIVINQTAAGQLASKLLESSNYQVVVAESCLEARLILATQRVDIVLLGSPPQEQCLPPMDSLYESGNPPAVIALLDANEQERYLACHQEGALDCLMAPFTTERLIKSIERCLAIKSLEREKRDFISMLSHDLKNPLTAAIGSIDLVREKRLGSINKEQVSYLDSAIESCNEVVTMIDNLLDIHRFEAGRMSLNKSDVNLSELVNQVINNFRGMIKHAKIQLHTKIGEQLPILSIDRNRLARVLANLLTNAVKFTTSGGEISITCCREVSAESKLAVVLKVQDTGVGIATVNLPIIFERFVQAHNHTGRGSGGSGLGLAFCKMTVEAHGGTITAESAEGKGSTFTITLPIPEEQTEAQ